MSGGTGVILLAGGRSTRMGADKAQVRVNGRRLVDIALATLPDGAPRVVVSPVDLGLNGVRTVSEDPPFGGPVAGIAAGLAELVELDGLAPGVDFVAVLPVDAPAAALMLPTMRRAIGERFDVAVVEDAEGRLQPLCALWRRQALSAALDAIEVRDAPARALIAAAGSIVAVAGTGAERDYDTPGALAELGDVTLPED